MRRHITIAMFLVATLAACTKNDSEMDWVGGDDALRFDAETRAANVTTDLSSLYTSFPLDCYYYQSDSKHGQYFEDEIKYKSSRWSGSKAQYWPSAGWLEFFAYTPEDYVTYSKNEIAYVCPSDPDSQKDLLAAYKDDVTRVNSSGVVQLDFKHILSKLLFKVTINNETNVTLNTINVIYHNIESENTYDFTSGNWGSATAKFEDEENFAEMSVDKNMTGIDKVVFDFDDNHSMYILPQKISIPTTSPNDLSDIDLSDNQYISISITYTLSAGMGEDGSVVQTGNVALPAADASNLYKPGTVYNYTLEIEGEHIEIMSTTVEIEDKEPDVMTYGNIDLGMILAGKTLSEIGLNAQGAAGSQYIADHGVNVMLPTDFDADTKYSYHTTAERVRDLLDDDVEDFVVVGDLGCIQPHHDGYDDALDAGNFNTLGNSKLGSYGAGTSPFTLGAILAGNERNKTFSIDMRGAYNYPTLEFAHGNAGSHVSGSTALSSDLDPKAPVLIPGLFQDVVRLDEIILPNEIIAIGDYAFSGCSNLRTVEIPNVQHIEPGGFNKCTSLTTVIGDNITRVHDNGFDSCENLVNINLDQLVQADNYAFVNCKSLTYVNLSDLVEVGMHSFDGCNHLWTDQFSTKKFDAFPDYVFSGCNSLGASNATGDGAIQSVDLSICEYVGNHSFNLCNFDFIGSEYNSSAAVESTKAAFKGYTTDERKAFNATTTLAANAFNSCHNFSGFLYFPEVVDMKCEYMENEATTVENSDGTTTTYYGDGDGTLAEYTKLPDAVFYDCTNIEGISMPKVTRLGNGSFGGCTSLKTLDLSGVTHSLVEFVEYNNPVGGQFTPGWRLRTDVIATLTSLRGCLEYIDLSNMSDEYPEGYDSSNYDDNVNRNYDTTTADDDTYPGGAIGTFENFAKLKVAKVNKLENIRNSLFSGCSALTTVDISGVETFGSNVFKDCSELKTIIGSENIKAISSGDFFNCSALEELDLSGVESYEGWDIFGGCSSLKTLNLAGVEEFDFDRFKADGTNVGSTTLETLILSNATEIKNLFVYPNNNFPNLKTLDIGSMETVELGFNIIEQWNKLTKLDIGGTETLPAIGNLPNLTHLNIGSVTVIPAWNFQISNLQVLDASSVTTITWGSFSGCTSLTHVNLSGLIDYNCTDWDTDAFDGATTNNCVIYLSDVQYGLATDNGNNTAQWQGHTWKTVVKASTSESKGTPLE